MNVKEREHNQSFALIFLKPGYNNPDTITALQEQLRENKFSVVHKGTFQFDEDTAEQFYSHLKTKQPPVNSINRHNRYMTSETVNYWVVTSLGSLEQNFFDQIGVIKRSLRQQFAPRHRIVNVIHASDSSEATLRELELTGIELTTL